MHVQQRGFFKRVRDRWIYFRRVIRNKPLYFHWVQNEGEAVGGPIDIYHLTLYDMVEHLACGAVTGLVLLYGLRINAIQVLGFERLDEWSGKTTIQPRWVENLGSIDNPISF